jgi:acetyl esterase/lipase
MSAAMLAGVGVAAADSPPGSDTRGTTSSESAKPTENKADSDNDGANSPKPKPSGEKPKKDATADPKGVVHDTDAAEQGDEDKTEPPAQQPDEEPTTVKDSETTGSDTAEKLADPPVKPVVLEHQPAAKPVAKHEVDEPNGYTVPADWYIPDTAEPPTRLIYLQHGFLASGPWYSYTAANLAEQTNSIVVAPSITSNFLSCDACWLGAPPMQRAVANLFTDDNTALADSARAAGYSGPIPDRVVLVGHSLGGGLVAGTAGYMVDNNIIDRLAGVVMLDGVGLDGLMTSSLEKVPGD